MNSTSQLSVLYHGRKVGTMALYRNRLAAFEYAGEWLSDGFSVSPLSLPLTKKVFLPKPDPNDGLFGVFADSLPDGWGRLLVDRLLLKNHINPLTVGVLDRLADLFAVAKEIGLRQDKAKQTALQIRECVEERLSKYLSRFSK